MLIHAYTEDFLPLELRIYVENIARSSIIIDWLAQNSKLSLEILERVDVIVEHWQLELELQDSRIQNCPSIYLNIERMTRDSRA